MSDHEQVTILQNMFANAWQAIIRLCIIIQRQQTRLDLVEDALAWYSGSHVEDVLRDYQAAQRKERSDA